MLELELSLIFFVFGIIFGVYIFPVWIKPRLMERWTEETKEVKRSFSTVTWPEHKPCPDCGSKTKHRQDCPQHPKNKVKT